MSCAVHTCDFGFGRVAVAAEAGRPTVDARRIRAGGDERLPGVGEARLAAGGGGGAFAGVVAPEAPSVNASSSAQAGEWKIAGMP